MHLARILRFFGLRSRHGGGGRRSRLSIRMSRVFHRHSSRRSTVDSGAAPTPGVGQRAPARCSEAPSRMLIPENEPVALDWGMSSSNSMDLRKSSRSSLARQDDLDRRLLVQRLILEELQHHARRGTAATRDSRMSMIEQAQVLSTSLLEARGSGVFSLRPASRDGRVQSLSRREEKQLRKSIARTIRAEEKQQKKLEKLNRKRAKQYARAQEFFEQRSTDASYFHTSSYNRSGQSDSCHFDVIDATETKRRRHRSDSAASSLSRRSSNTSVRSRSSSKPPRMEFLFFGGSPDDTGSLHELEIGRRLLQRRSSAVRNDTVLRGANSLETYDAELIKINPTLVRNMPRPFAPRMNRLEVFI